MPLYIAIDVTTKRQRRLSSVQQADVEPIAEDEQLIVDDTRDVEPPPSVERWNPDLPGYDAVVTPAFHRTKISKREFRNRIGQPVRLAILAIQRGTDPAQADLRDLLTDMKETLDSVPDVDLTNADTIAGMQGLQQIGLLSAEDVTRILAPSTVEEE